VKEKGDDRALEVEAASEEEEYLKNKVSRMLTYADVC
jgi:hypothetical protein